MKTVFKSLVLLLISTFVYSQNGDLEVEGTIKADSLVVTNGANDGFILVSDNLGGTKWIHPDSLMLQNDEDWTIMNNNIYNNTANRFGFGTSNPTEKFTFSGGNLSIERGNVTSNALKVLKIEGARNNNTMPFAEIQMKNYDDNGSATEYIGAKITSFNVNAEDSGDLRFYTKDSIGSIQERLRISEVGNIGINTVDPLAKLTILEPENALLSADTVDVSNLAMVLRKNSIENQQAVGLGFQSSTFSENVGSAILFERTDYESKGKMHFATKTSNAIKGDIPIHMTISDDGNVGIGTTTPAKTLDVEGTSQFSDNATFNDTTILNSYSEFNGSSKFYDNVVFNEGGEAFNFRVESLDGPEMLFVDASSNRIGINSSAPTATFDVYGSTKLNGPTTINDNAFPGSDFRVESVGSPTMLFVDAGSNEIGINNSNPTATLDVSGTTELDGPTTVNESGNPNFDFRVQSINSPEMLFVDASVNRVGINSSAPTATLNVNGTTEFNGNSKINGDLTVNDSGYSNNDLRVESDTRQYMLFVDASTDKIGINNSNPTTELDVNGTIRTDSLIISNGAANNYILSSDATGSASWVDPNTMLSDWTVEVDTLYNDTAANVGIGTSSPNSKLEVAGGDMTVSRGAATNGTTRSIDIIGARNAGSQSYGRINFRNMDDNDSLIDYTGARIASYNEGSVLSGDLRFYTVDELDIFERMTITKDGNIGIGTTSPLSKLDVEGSIFASGGDLYTAEINGVINVGGGIMNASINIISDSTPVPSNADGDEDLYIEDELEVAGQAYKTGGGVWQTASDERLKRDINNFEDGLTTLMQIEPVKFKYNNILDLKYPDKEYVGIIAQEVLDVAPYMIKESNFFVKKHEDENGNEIIDDAGTPYYTYDGSALTYILVNAVKEQQAEIEKLKNEKIKSNEDLNLVISELQSLKNELKTIKEIIEK